MGMDLKGKDSDFAFNLFAWGNTLRLACMYGWEPAGTRAPRKWGRKGKRPPWEGGYDTNDGQRVTDEDAAALADALERALPDVPTHDALAHKTREVGGIRCIPYDADVSPLEYLSGKGRTRLTEFIRFCRDGGFEIW
jgi:hypothetical protein